MVALDLVHASNAQLRELGPGLVALFGMQSSIQLDRVYTDNSLQWEQHQVSANLLPKPSSATQLAPMFTLWAAMPLPQSES
jgi:hypothetical protein